MKIVSPCVSVCVTEPITGFCYGCARTEEEKQAWKNPETKEKWKKEQLSVLKSRMSGFQLKAFTQSYNYKKKSGTSLIKEARLNLDRN
ncbi:MAG: DUF1289 domain-containing protein [Gammaproteobacteria bacterium]